MQLQTDKMLARVEDGIGWMTFNAPERRNALSMEMQLAIPEILGAFNEDPDVRVVVMHGAGGRAFVSGADISEFGERRSSPESIGKYDDVSGRSFGAYARLEKPLIAMIQGYCLGGGLMTAMRADIRIASQDSQFGIPAVRLGLGYGFGGVKNLVDLVGHANAREILLTGGRFNAERALAMGLVNQVVAVEELEPTVRQLAATIAGNAPLTVRALKYALDQALRESKDRNPERMDELVAACFASSDYAEGRRAFLEKRPPVFTGQ